MSSQRCTSWRLRWFVLRPKKKHLPYEIPYFPRVVRCSWRKDRVAGSKWHCAERTTGHVWLVRDKERDPYLTESNPEASGLC